MADDLDDDIAKYGDLTSVELFGGIADNMNYLLDSSQVGEIALILVGVAGVPTPDATIWQLCDGSAITEPLSPLVGQSTPDLRDTYLKGTTGGDVGTITGSNTKNLQHNHGGVTSTFDPDPDSCDFSHGEYYVIPHHHDIVSDLGTAINFEPLHVRLKHFLKIR